ncbi:MAG: YraN family protein [Acetatifactor sp.]|nr:YraN family protein [Acetatifactor sp.]
MEADKNKRQLGADKEQLAAEYLTAQGMDILERNFRNRQGEIDIIGRHGKYVVFVEVKFRSGTDKGMAVEAVDIRKQRQICKVADYYRMIHHLRDNTAVRYDVLAIQGEDIQWIQNAFPHINRRFYR